MVSIFYCHIRPKSPSDSLVDANEGLTSIIIRIGEKMIDWSDETPSIETILGNVSLWWFTGCYPSSIWPYREVGEPPVRCRGIHSADLQSRPIKLVGPNARDRTVAGSMDKIKKPFGSSWFPYELASVPKSWAEATGKVSFFKSHDKVRLLNRPSSPKKLLTVAAFREDTLLHWSCLMFSGRTS